MPANAGSGVTTGTVPLVTFSRENVTMGTVPFVTLCSRKIMLDIFVNKCIISDDIVVHEIAGVIFL